nr:replicase [Grapevine-associated tymo-like virus]
MFNFEVKSTAIVAGNNVHAFGVFLKPRLNSLIRGGGRGSDGINDGVNSMGTTMHRDAVTQDIANRLINDIAEAKEICPYSMSPAAVDMLLTIGIPASRSFTASHRHPMHKSLENWILRKVVPNLVTFDCTVAWMKPVKFDRLSNNEPKFKQLVNPVITPRDFARYRDTKRVASLTQSLLIHDAMHYMSKEEVYGLFVENPDLQEVIATVVYPCEVLKRQQSLFPLLYDLTYTKEGFVYSMEGDDNDHYVQPYNDWVITTKYLVGKMFRITIERIEGFFGHHVFVLRRGNYRAPDHYLSPMPNCVLLPDTNLLMKGERERLVPREIYDKAVHHARNLKALRAQDAIAKVRSYQHDSAYGWVDPGAWEYLTRYVISAVAVLGDSPDIVSEIDTHPFILKLKALWKNRGFKLTLLVVSGGLACVLTPTILCWQLIPLTTWIAKIIVGSELGLAGFVAYKIWPHWLSPAERERKRLAWLYPKRHTDLILLEERKISQHQVHELLCDMLSEGAEFPTFTPIPKAKPDSLISNGTDQSDPGPSVSEVACAKNEADLDSVATVGSSANFTVTLRKNSGVGERDCALMNEENKHVEESEDSLFAEKSKLNCSSAFTAETVEHFSLKSDETITVRLPKIVLTRVKDLKSEDKVVMDKNFLTVAGAELKDEKVADISLGLNEEVITKKKKKNRVKRNKKKDGSDVNSHLEQVTIIPAEGIDGEGWLHKRFGVADDVALGQYSNCADDEILFDGDFEEVPLCLLDALENSTGVSRNIMIEALRILPKKSVVNEETKREGLSDWHAAALAYYFCWELNIYNAWVKRVMGVRNGAKVDIWHVMVGSMGHFTHVRPRTATLAKGAEPGSLHGASLGTKRFQEALLAWRGGDDSAIPFLGFRGHVVDVERARFLARDMANGRTGILFGPAEKSTMDSDTQVRWKFLVDGQEQRLYKHRARVHVAAIYGYPGCGKTWPLAQVLNKVKGLDYRVAVPTVKLRDEWLNMLQLVQHEKWRVNTYESTMRKNTEILIVDEISMMPSGYIDFLIAISPRLRCVLILGDVTQTDRHESHPDASCSRLLAESLYWRKYSPFYLGFTRRLSRHTAKLFGVNTFSTVEGADFRRETRGPGVILTALSGDVRMLAELGQSACTFPSSQGSTFDDYVQILMDRSALEKCSLGAVHTAVTRSRKGNILVGRLTGLWWKAAISNPFWRAILLNEPCDWRIVFSDVLQDFHILNGPYKPNKLSGGLLVEHGFPLDMLPPMRRVGHTCLVEELPIEVEAFDEEVVDEPARVTWGQMDAKVLFDSVYKLRPVDAVSRLRRYKGEPSKQFCDGEPEGRNEDGIYPEMVAARHKRADDTLLPLSVEKRLRFRPLAANKREVLSKSLVGQELFQSYCRLMELDPLRPFSFNEILYHDCINFNEWHSLTNKTQAMILANENKSDPDWVWTFIRVFMKQQRKINDSTLNGDWKAGQTISNMNDQWLLYLGPTIRYMSKLEKKYCPKRIYLHGGRSNIDLDNFCRDNLTVGEKYANDYTSFDQSQTGEVLASELLYMWHAGIPEVIINCYESNKVDMFCAFGHLQTMRFSGEPATYAFNCRCNLAVLNLQFPLDRNLNVPIFVSGDDGGLGTVLPERSTWNMISNHLTLQAKPLISDRMVFVGYICTHLGAIRDPVPMLARFYLADDAGKLHQIVQSYATELSTGYLMAEGVFEMLNDFELDCFFCLVRAFHLKHASSRLKFRKSALLGFVNLSEKALGRVGAGARLGPDLRRDLVSYYWRLTENERAGVEKQVQNLVNANLYEFGRR